MKTIVRAAELPTLLETAPVGVEILSLDCFDTLVWRNVQAPTDVFAELPIPGGAIWPRRRAEHRARLKARFEHQRIEVSIEEIYANLYPSGSDEVIAEAVRHELAVESRHCYAFLPTVELIRDAKARGLKVIVVSDTYLSEPQLRALIGDAAGEDVAGLIDRIFCSSRYGMSKADGLFRHVLSDLGVAAEAIVHVGDNVQADRHAPAELGVHGVHFRQFDPAAEQRLRLEAAAASILDPTVRDGAPAFQPHRPLVALRTKDDAAWTVGHDVLGPILHAFARWVEREADEMSARIGRPVKLLFLLRDGHLPKRVFDRVAAGRASSAAELSRYTARRAAFVEAQAVADYLGTQTQHERTDVLARQLGLLPDERRKLGCRDQAEFSRAALSPPVLRKITERARSFGDRLFAHLQAQGVERGDAVMLVDLGYNGTVQNQVEPILAERYGLTVAGRYLLLREEQQTGLDKKGLIDSRHFDFNALHALSSPISLIGLLCTAAQGSVVDYRPDGTPTRNEGGAKGVQNALRDRVQEGCLAFAASAEGAVVRPARSDDEEARRRMALGALARLLFLPTAAEVEIFETFEHDVNLGTDDMIQLLDAAGSADGLRRRGLFYLNGADRMYLPGELQPHGLPLNIALFAANRFGLDLRAQDFRVGSLKLPVILADERSQTAIDVDAHVTHDGYYVATIPVGAGRFAAGIQFGAVCEWLQVDEIAYYRVEDYGAGLEEEAPVPASPMFEGMRAEALGLYRCSPGALMLAPPPSGLADAPHLLSVTFRPIKLRRAEALQEAA
jgi:FMN phosphatase YigB (HAD superfamily)